MQKYFQSQYQKNDIITADRGKLVLLLYEGAMGYLHNAKECIRKGDVSGKSNYLNRVFDIIQELNASLKMEEGGEIAQSLRSLYVFLGKHLMKAKIERDGTQKIDEAIFILKELGDAWQKIMDKPEVKHMRETDVSNLPGLSKGFRV
jgi:flagellar secretion chaperone FliS